MAEIMARIGPAGSVELIDDRSMVIPTVGAMTPMDAAYLARGMLASAVALSGPNAPSPGTIVGDAHLPIMKWAVGASSVTGDPVLIFRCHQGST